MQGANWETLRALARDLGEVGYNNGENVFGIVEYQLDSNSVTFVFADGSAAAFVGQIRKDAS